MTTFNTNPADIYKTLEDKLEVYGAGARSLGHVAVDDLRGEPVHGESPLIVSLEEARDMEDPMTPFERTEAVYRGYGNPDIERGVDAFGATVFGNYVPTERTAWENCDVADIAGQY